MRQVMLASFVKYFPWRLSLKGTSTFQRITCCHSYCINNFGFYHSYSGQHVYSDKKINFITPLFQKAEKYQNRVAIFDQHGIYLYSDLLHFSNILADKLFSVIDDKGHIAGKQVVFLCDNDASYVIAQWAIWMYTGCAVPLSKSHPESELEYFVTNSNSSLIITTEEYTPKMRPIADKHNIKLLEMKDSDYKINAKINEQSTQTAVIRSNRNNRNNQLLQHNKFKSSKALIVYTSGTTGRPKGVVHTFCSLQAQMENMISAWGWTSSDVILHVLPLHHVHGIVNTLMTPLYCGAACVMMPHFEAQEVWNIIMSSAQPNINVFMAVPTIYVKLIKSFEERFSQNSRTKQVRDYIRATCLNKFRLMVSGSAALPETIMNKWKELTGHKLLERYGMTETGMALTNQLHGDRIPGTVGIPFPNVEVQIAQSNVYSPTGYDILVQGNSQGSTVTSGCIGQEGELLIKGPSLFSCYYGSDSKTLTDAEFTADGWFKTGDTASYKDGVYKILGRTSVDIIKSGGYKISALDIEAHLLIHENIVDVAIVGIPDMTWGQKVAAVVVLGDQSTDITLEELRDWARDSLAPYQLPTVVKVLKEMPRNAMGKVNKKHLLHTVLAAEYKRGLL